MKPVSACYKNFQSCSSVLDPATRTDIHVAAFIHIIKLGLSTDDALLIRHLWSLVECHDLQISANERLELYYKGNPTLLSLRYSTKPNLYNRSPRRKILIKARRGILA